MSFAALEVGIVEEAEDAFEALPEEAFAGHRFGSLACGSQVAAPGEAEDEGQGD